jgi:hypothetical protein
MEPGCIAENQGSRRTFENHVLGGGNLAFHFSVWWIRNSKRICPWKYILVWSSDLTANEVFHGAVIGINLVEIEKRSNFSVIFRVAVPSLGENARISAQGQCMPHIKVNQL